MSKPGIARLYAVSNGKYTAKYQEVSPIVILKCSEGSGPVSPWVPLAKHLFGKGLQSVFILDVSSLMSEMPRENSTAGMGPILKPMSRVLKKLNVADATFVGLTTGSALACKLARQAGMGELFARIVVLCVGHPEKVPSFREAPEEAVPLHVLQMQESAAAMAKWNTLNNHLVTSTVVPKGGGGAEVGLAEVVLALQTYLLDEVLPELPIPSAVDVCGAELVYSVSQFDKQQVATITPFVVEGAVSVSAPPVHTDPSEPLKKAVLKLDTIPEWWIEDEADFFAGESHVWSVRPGAAIHAMQARVVEVGTPDAEGVCVARVADVNGTVRVAFNTENTAHTSAFKIGDCVELNGRVAADSNGIPYISLPPKDGAATVVPYPNILVGDRAETTVQMAQEKGLGVGDVQNRVGCLLLRGRKVALSRRKRGGRTELVVPSGVVRDEETMEAGAMRVLAEGLDVDVEEFRFAGQLGTFTHFPAPGVVETVFVAFAAGAPPDGAAKDSTDLPVDPTSPYDWFLLAHALRVTSHEWHNLLWELARRMHGAHKAQIILPQWRCGLFGVREVDEERGHVEKEGGGD